MSKNKQIPHYQHFYQKRLNTETFSSPSLKEQFIQLSAKIQQQILTVKKNMRVKNLRIFRNRQNLSTIENREKMIRDQLRAKIQQKAKLSQSNLQEIMVEKRSHSKSKDKLRQTTISRIKSMQKTSLDESFRKSTNYSKNTQSFLQQRKQRSNVTNITRTTSFIDNQTNSRYETTKYKMHQSVSLMDSRKKILPRVLKIDDKTLQQKLLKKNYLFHQKESKNIHELIQTFKQIEIKRQLKAKKLKQASILIQKERRSSQQKMATNNKMLNKYADQQFQRKSFDGYIKQSIKRKYEFSQEYNKRLSEKRAIKEYHRQQLFEQGNHILQRESLNKHERKNSKIISQTIKQVQKSINFNNREKMKK